MATHDYVINNQSGSAFRADLNDALAAIVTQNSSSTPPATPYAYQYWVDTSANPPLLKQRNAANNGWITFAEVGGQQLLGDGTASKPAYAFVNDTNTGLYRAADNAVGIVTGGTESVRIDSSGRVGIGILEPSAFKTNADDLVIGNLLDGNGHGITIASGTSNAGRICFADGTSDDAEQRGMLVYNHATPADTMNIFVESTQVATFDSNDLYVMGANPSGGSTLGGIVKAKGFNTKLGHGGPLANNVFNISWSSPNARLWIDDQDQGIISTTSSDYRIKKDVETISTNCIDRIKLLRPVQYQIKDYGLFVADAVTREGFIAHEVGEVIPSGCEGEKDAENQIQSLRLDAILSVTVKALQEAVTKIETLEARVAILEAS